jgi:hypothetical protein
MQPGAAAAGKDDAFHESSKAGIVAVYTIDWRIPNLNSKPA